MAKPCIHLKSIGIGAINSWRRSIDAQDNSTQYIVYTTRDRVPSTCYTVQSPQCTAHSTQYTAHRSQYKVLSTNAQYTPRSTQYTVQRTLRYEVQITSPSVCGSVMYVWVSLGLCISVSIYLSTSAYVYFSICVSVYLRSVLLTVVDGSSFDCVPEV